MPARPRPFLMLVCYFVAAWLLSLVLFRVFFIVLLWTLVAVTKRPRVRR